MLAKVLKRIRRHAKIRATVEGTAKRPRLAIFRSNSNIYAQLIDDEKRVTLGAVSDLKIKKS
jgi:large subunit ribosomal protein L18